MCGIAGVIGSRLTRNELAEVLFGMQQRLNHRGPDDHGVFISHDGRAALLNTRLSVLDLSHAAHQPMSSADGRYHIVFNGEIYNFKELRDELIADGERFRSDGDTEVVLKMFQRYGTECVRELAGMFAFAIWDSIEESLFLARDPLGVKPLYYTQNNSGVIFASEVHAIVRSGLVPRDLSSRALGGYLLYGAVPEPWTLVEGIQALPAGHHLKWRNGQKKVTKFWELQFHADLIDHGEAVKAVRGALEESVQRHLISDVPVGVFLSGGIDSTAVVALASRVAGANLQTFSISFADPNYNEGDVAERTARHFHTDHHDWRLDSASAKELLNDFLVASDQPSIDGFNTYCVCKLAHDRGLKVVLSGLGGDEIFGGYQSFQLVPQMVRASRAFEPMRRAKGAAGKLLENFASSSPTKRLGHFLGQVPITATAYWAMRGIFTPREVSNLLKGYGCDEQSGRSPTPHVPPQPTLEDEVSYLEVTRYMRNQLLRDSDVMSMAWSLELRVPFVDSRLVDCISRVPAALRLGKGKRLLLDAVPEIPEWVRSRPKQGFTFPFEEWVTTQWRDVFAEIQSRSPVRLRNWYRTWCLFALENFLEKNALTL
ncbi:MAG: asparagine synthase (glutamine-hydrolyzing) [Bryobacteraceae bacterium]